VPDKYSSFLICICGAEATLLRIVAENLPQLEARPGVVAGDDLCSAYRTYSTYTTDHGPRVTAYLCKSLNRPVFWEYTQRQLKSIGAR